MVSDLSKHIDAILGKPFQLHGRGPSAYDCLGVVRHLALVHFGIELEDPMGEGCARRIRELQNRFLKLPNLACVQPGDVIRLAGLRGPADQSVAMVEDHRWVVTASEGVGVYRTTLSRLPDYPSVEAFRLKENV